MHATFECPDCLRGHDEPAEATLGLRARCFDCAFERHEARAQAPLSREAFATAA